MSLSAQRTSFHTLGAHKAKGQLICGFLWKPRICLKTRKQSLQKKNADMIVANNLKVAGAGFGTDTNVVTLITADDCTELEIMDKSCVAAKDYGPVAADVELRF